MTLSINTAGRSHRWRSGRIRWIHPCSITLCVVAWVILAFNTSALADDPVMVTIPGQPPIQLPVADDLDDLRITIPEQNDSITLTIPSTPAGVQVTFPNQDIPSIQIAGEEGLVVTIPDNRNGIGVVIPVNNTIQIEIPNTSGIVVTIPSGHRPPVPIPSGANAVLRLPAPVVSTLVIPRAASGLVVTRPKKPEVRPILLPASREHGIQITLPARPRLVRPGKVPGKVPATTPD